MAEEMASSRAALEDLLRRLENAEEHLAVAVGGRRPELERGISEVSTGLQEDQQGWLFSPQR